VAEEPSVKIRPYRATDRDGLVDLWRIAFPNTPPHNEPARMIDAKLAVDDLILIAEESEIVVGACMAGYDGHRGWLYALAVRPESRRKGLGVRIVLHAVEKLRELGCIKVNLQIRADNAEVEAFYQTLGFAREDRISMGLRID